MNRPAPRTIILVSAAALMPLATVACGNSDDESGASSDGETVDLDGAVSCLADAGFDTVRESEQDEALVLPEEYKSSIGMIESVSLGFVGDAKGTGSVAFFDDADAAAEEFEAASGFRTDEVLAGRSGAVTWDYIVTAGEDPGVVGLIEGCL